MTLKTLRNVRWNGNRGPTHLVSKSMITAASKCLVDKNR